MVDIRSAASELRALLAQYTQDTRLLRLITPLGHNVLLVEQIDGREGLSEVFRFDITVLEKNIVRIKNYDNLYVYPR